MCEGSWLHSCAASARARSLDSRNLPTERRGLEQRRPLRRVARRRGEQLADHFVRRDLLGHPADPSLGERPREQLLELGRGEAGRHRAGRGLDRCVDRLDERFAVLVRDQRHGVLLLGLLDRAHASRR